MSRIGFIGMGAMGQPMGHLLHQAGHTLVIRDTHAAAVEKFSAGHPGTVVAQGAADFAGCDLLITMLLGGLWHGAAWTCG